MQNFNSLLELLCYHRPYLIKCLNFQKITIHISIFFYEEK